MKNSYGIDDFRISYMFMGQNGLMVELPSAKQFEQNPKFYDDVINPPNKVNEYLK